MQAAQAGEEVLSYARSGWRSFSLPLAILPVANSLPEEKGTGWGLPNLGHQPRAPGAWCVDWAGAAPSFPVQRPPQRLREGGGISETLPSEWKLQPRFFWVMQWCCIVPAAFPQPGLQRELGEWLCSSQRNALPPGSGWAPRRVPGSELLIKA